MAARPNVGMPGEPGSRHPNANTNLIYHQTIIPTQKITHCVVGTFTLPGASDFVVVRHDTMELWTLHVNQNTAECVHSTRLFTNISQIATVPTISETVGQSSASREGGILDSHSNSYRHQSEGGSSALQRLAVTSETGTIVLLRYDLDELPIPARLMHDPTDVGNNGVLETAPVGQGNANSLRGRFVRVSEVDLGRSGARLTVPGARLAVDPLGRAVFVAALMRQKVVIPLRRHEEYYTERINSRTAGGVLSSEGGERSALLMGDVTAVGAVGLNEEANIGGGSEDAAQRKKVATRDIISFGAPLEAHRQTMIYCICSLDGATENATFASLEQELPEVNAGGGATPSATAAPTTVSGSGQAYLRLSRTASQGGGLSNSAKAKQLVVYAFASGLQQVQRTHLIPVPATAHRLVAVPAYPFGPGGVLVCTDAEVIWYDVLPQLHGCGLRDGKGGDLPSGSSAHKQFGGLGPLAIFKTAAPFPRRADFREQLYDPMIISHASTCVRNDFFMLLQDDQGDVFRVTLTLADVQRSYDALRAAQQKQQQMRNTRGVLDANEAGASAVTAPSPLVVAYFDTIPPTSAMVLFRRGFVFAGSESAPTHGLYKIIKDGYGADSEYILTRMRMVEQSRGGGAQQDARPSDDSKDSSDSHTKNCTVDDEAANGDKSSNGNVSNSSASDPTALSGGESRGTVPSGAIPPPSFPAKAAMALPHPSVLLRKLQPNSRVVPLFHPHQTLQHMVLLESYPNTPPVTSLIVNIPQGQQKQPQVQIDAVVGRGSDSVLLHARYGYAARLESSFTLPAVFTHLMPLASAAVLQARWRERQHEVTRSSSLLGGDNHGSDAGGRRQASKKRGYRGGQSPICDDKLLLSTRQGTTVLSLGLGKQVEPDTLSGFITTEHTIAAGTLRYGIGYMQITPTCILVLPYHGDGVSSHYQQSASVAESVTWMHPHGKRILAADISCNTVVVSFAQGGGIASFDMGISGSRLQQLEMLPTFPHAPAISLLRDPSSGTNVFGSRNLHSLTSTLILAAIATISHEVYIVNPKKLREPLETIRCTSFDERGGGGSGAVAGDTAPAITSVLLTYLGSTGGARRLFCFIGHIDGTVTRCELDHVNCKVIDRAVLTCGSAPCQIIAGDGERVCYILCGEFNWRCDVRDGMPKTVPWRFPTPQATYASFRRPAPPTSSSSASGSGRNAGPEVLEGTNEELVLGVAGNTLSLFAAGVASTTAEMGLEYSFGYTPLPVAGRRLLQHPMRPEYLLVIGTEHRGYGLAALRRAASAARHKDGGGSGSGDATAADSRAELAAGTGGIPLDKPQRSLNHPNYYVSTLQLYNRRTDRLDPPIYFQEGEAVLSATVGSFLKDFGREPVVVLGCAEHFTHGSGLGTGASWTQGCLRAFRFVVGGAAGSGGSAVPTLRLEKLHDTPIAASTTSFMGCEEDGSDDNAAGHYGHQPGAGPQRAVGGAVTDYPSALHICVEVGLLFVGMGAASGLHVYAWGQRRFLRKRRLPNVPGRITTIETVFTTPPSVVSSSSTTAAAATPGSATYAADLFRCGPNSSSSIRERRLLIVCGTVDQSVFIATVQPGITSGTAGSMSFLMLIARDAVPRGITSVACLDERTIAAADRFGNVVFLRLPHDARLGFAEPLQNLTDIELVEAERYAANEQLLEEIAFHRTGQLVTSLRVQDYDPSEGTDPTLALRILFYATTLGAVGAYTPFVREEDATLAAHLQPLIASHVRCLLLSGSGQPAYNAAARLSTSCAAFTSVVHHVIEGDYAQLLLHTSTSLFSTEARSEMEEALAHKERTEAAQRNVLSLPKRVWPTIGELVAKQRALVALPP